MKPANQKSVVRRSSARRAKGWAIEDMNLGARARKRTTRMVQMETKTRKESL